MAIASARRQLIPLGWAAPHRGDAMFGPRRQVGRRRSGDRPRRPIWSPGKMTPAADDPMLDSMPRAWNPPGLLVAVALLLGAIAVTRSDRSGITPLPDPRPPNHRRLA